MPTPMASGVISFAPARSAFRADLTSPDRQMLLTAPFEALVVSAA
jgi:hypothetical protein